MKSVLALVALLLAPACTKPYEAPPLGPSSSVVQPTTTPSPTPSVTPLTVSLSIGRATPEVRDTISFVATTGSPITKADWSFGNGTTQTTSVGFVAYAYPAIGTFVAQVTVTARDGRTATDQATVTVRRRDTPTPDADTDEPSTPTILTLGVTLTCTPKPALTPTPCNVTASYGGSVLPSTRVLKVVWDWGTGVTTTTFAPGAPSSAFPYPLAGSYTVFATVTADVSDGWREASASRAIVVP